MADLILNFEVGPTTTKTRTSHIQTTPGSWTHKHKQKRRAKQSQTKTVTNTTTETTTETAETTPIQSVKRTNDEETLPESRKKSKLDNPPSKPIGRLQIISSLFSSTIIPTIKPQTNDSLGSMVVYAPSNASLSTIQVTSSSLSLHPQISSHLSTSSKVGPIKSPTAIQSIAWPLLSSTQPNTLTRDIIIQSETGSGKTLAYLVPIIQDLLTLAINLPQITWSREIGTLAIILVPTRELAEQVYHVAIDLLSFAQRSSNPKNMEGQQTEDQPEIPVDGLNPRWLVPGTLHGGTNRTHEKARLRRGLPLLVCTPGRLLDHLEKTVSLRMAGEPIQFSNDPNSKIKVDSRSIGKLNLRWLVVDEADRLMDMGFEDQMHGILKHLTQRESKTNISQAESSVNPRRRTILCSATMPDGVKKLVGLSLNDPILLRASDQITTSNQDSINQSSVPTPSDTHQVAKSESHTTFSAPAQLSQYYIITPPKLRLVSLIALLRQITHQSSDSDSKVLVFFSCTNSVDFHFEALGGITSTENEEEEEEGNKKLIRRSKFLPGVKIYRLHGSLDLQTRLKSLNEFSKPEKGVRSILLCTSLAGRGIDVPNVGDVIQYDLPTEGGINEYLHRVGRTARAGSIGNAWAFVLPEEEGWVHWCQSIQNQNQNLNQKQNSQLVEIGVQKVLVDGFKAGSQKDSESKATDTQMSIERWVIEKEENKSLASLAFSSHIRAYSTHPINEKKFFHIKNLHLGHLAKSFGLREPPKSISNSNPNPKSHKSEKSHDRDNSNGKKNTTIGRKKSFKNLHDEDKDEDEDLDDEDGLENRVSTFKSLTQFKHAKNGNTLRGPIFNSIDEFNLG
ncbi:hypothetical protein MJO28_002981 [Puccinia striiformis f. sp. tritici]|uniref:Uncharacterized protein n=1 Tax=Puccinia striiformis f. sp. tritici TaxID=168172 RepID=A0ACC0ETJ7_9BASI|nr:hypothetical protein MJO28_002981 [Puccinia striiformis f. sp. tritici]